MLCDTGHSILNCMFCFPSSSLSYFNLDAAGTHTDLQQPNTDVVAMVDEGNKVEMHRMSGGCTGGRAKSGRGIGGIATSHP